MDMNELAAGLERVAADSAAPEAAAWEPSMDWLMGSVGPFFNNNRGLGELLLDKLKDSGINTEGAALAGLVNVLQQFSQEYKALGEAVGENLDKINSLSDQSEDLASAIQDVLKEINVPKDDAASIPSDEGVGDIAMGALGGEAGMPSPDMGAGAGADMGGGMPPDMGAGAGMGAGAPADAGTGVGAPPDAGGGAGADTGGGMPPDMAGQQVSDARAKRILGYTHKELQGVLSDARMKRLAGRVVNRERKRRASVTKLNPNIIDSCNGGY